MFQDPITMTKTAVPSLTSAVSPSKSTTSRSGPDYGNLTCVELCGLDDPRPCALPVRIAPDGFPGIALGDPVAHKPSCLVTPPEPGPAKPGVLRPGFVGMRGQWSYDYGMQDYEYTPLPPMVI